MAVKLGEVALVFLGSLALGYGGARLWQGLPAAPPRLQEEVTPARHSDPGTVSAGASVASGGKESVREIAEIADKPRSLENDHALYAALQRMTAQELQAGADDMVALLKRLDDPFHGEPAAGLCEAWLERWLDVDPAAALRYAGASRFLDKLVPQTSNDAASARAAGAQGAAFRTLARRQPAWTETYLKNSPPAPERDVGVYALFLEVSKQDSAKAARVLAGFSSTLNRPAAVDGYVSGLAESDVRSAFSIAAGEPAGPFRTALLSKTVEAAAKESVAAARELVERVDDPSLRRELARSAVGTFIWQSSEDPLPWIKEETLRPSGPDDGMGERLWRNAVAQAVSNTPERGAAGADWALTLTNDPEHKMLGSILSMWANFDSGSVRSWLASHPTDLQGADLGDAAAAIQSMARQNLDSVTSWVRTLPPGNLRDEAQFQLALNSASPEEPLLSPALYSAVASRDSSGEVAERFAKGMLKQDGTAAADWAAGLPPGPARDRALAAVALDWSRSDARTAGAWIEAMAPGPDRDRMVKDYASSIAYVDPAAAAASVESVANPNKREETAAAVFWTWNNEDPVAARAWLRNLGGVDENWRARFLRNVK